MEKELNLKSAAEMKGARKVLNALKRAHRIKGRVALAGSPSRPAPKRRRRRNPPRGSSQYKEGYLAFNEARAARGLKPVTPGTYLSYQLEGRAKKYGSNHERALIRALEGTREVRSHGGRKAYVRNPKRKLTVRRRNIAGFRDADGVFHPIRSGERMTTYRGKPVLVPANHPYSRKKAHEKPLRGRTGVRSRSTGRARTSRRKNTTYASFMRQGRKKKKKPNPASGHTLPRGTRVTWHYRGAIGHGTVVGVHRRGTTAANTEYAIRQHDHHPGEASILYHYGRALTRAR